MTPEDPILAEQLEEIIDGGTFYDLIENKYIFGYLVRLDMETISDYFTLVSRMKRKMESWDDKSFQKIYKKFKSNYLIEFAYNKMQLNIDEDIRFQPKIGIYGLIDPDTNRLMYIGQSADIFYRYNCHINNNHHDTNEEKKKWLNELSRNGLKPRLIILKEFDLFDPVVIDASERELISHYKSLGQAILNLARGGAQDRGVDKAKNTHFDDWIELGKLLNIAWHGLGKALILADKLAGKKCANIIYCLYNEINVVKSKLEGIMLTANPTWKGQKYLHIFYGEDIEEFMEKYPNS